MGSIQLKLSIDSICGIMLNATDIQDSLSPFIKKTGQLLCDTVEANRADL